MSNLKLREEQLDTEIEEMEKAIYGTEGEGEKPLEASEENPSTPDQESSGEEASVESEEAEAQASPEIAEVIESQELSDEDDEGDEKKPKRIQWKRVHEKEKKEWGRLRASLESSLFDLRQENASQSEQIDRLLAKVSDLEQKLFEVQASQGDSIADYFDEEDREILGDKALKSLSKVIDNKVKPFKDKLSEKENEERTKAKERAEYRIQENNRIFRERLSRAVDNMSEIDTDPAFMEFLKEADPINGGSRLNWFKKRQAAGDVEGVAKYFKDFRAQKNASDGILEQKISPVSNTGQTDASRTARDARGPDQEVYPYSIVEKFHNDVVSGNFPGTPAERDALDKIFDRAYVEKRIDYNK